MRKIKTDGEKPPIFIIGNPRSGTTLLRLMLTCHSMISIPPEGGWLIQLYSKYRKVTIDDQEMIRTMVTDLFLTPKIEGWQLDHSLLMKTVEENVPVDYPGFANQIYRHYANRDGKTRWGDKNNFYLHHIGKINQMFPDAMFLHIIRDGRDVACSYRDLSETRGLYAPTLPNSVCIAAYDWKKNIETIRRDFKHIAKERTFTLRYEDLVRQPTNILQDVCSFLGEDYDDNMLLYAEKNRTRQLEPSVFMNWKALTQEAITTNRVERWKREMFIEDRLIFAFMANHILRLYNYETTKLKINLSSPLLFLYSVTRLFEHFCQQLVQKAKRKLRASSR